MRVDKGVGYHYMLGRIFCVVFCVEVCLFKRYIFNIDS